MSIAEQILASELFQSGKRFRPLQMSEHIGVGNRKGVACALSILRERGEATGGDGFFAKTRRSLIHRVKLNPNPPKCFGERNWVYPDEC